MSRIALSLAWLGLVAITASAAEAPARPAQAKPIGIVCGVRGSTAIVFLNEADAVKVGEQFAIRRPRLLVAVATPKGQVTRWADWRDVGRLAIRALRGSRYALASILPPKAAGDGPAALAVRTGDSIYRSAQSPSQ
jgi:hypothetical protein